MAIFQKIFLFKTKHKGLRKELQLLFLKRLSRLLHNGYTLIEALEIIKWDKSLRESADGVTAALKTGSSLDRAFETVHFNSVITTYLYFARASGDIQTGIDKCLYIYEKRINYMKKFKQVTRYPMILIVIFAILLYFIKQSVLPSFVNLFQTNTASSSMIAISIMIIDYATNFLYILLVLGFIGSIIWHLNKRKVGIEKQIKIYERIPVYKKYKQTQISFLFAAHFSSLLKTGISIKEILTTMAQQKKLPIISYYSTLMIHDLNHGKYITSLLSELKLLDKQLVHIFQKNADMYALEKDLSIYAELLTEELHQKIIKVITYIQPVFFIILAGFIVFIYITLMWPMFQLIKTI